MHLEIKQALTSILNGLLNLIYPAKCIACAKVLIHGSSLHVCELCFPSFEFVDERVYGEEFDFDYARSFFEYSDILRRVILDIKFGKKVHKMVSLADIAMTVAGDITYEYEEFDAVIPVPLHANRLKERGFNQAKLLAKTIANSANLPMDDDICVRIVDTMPQSLMSSSNRQDNVADVFRVMDGAEVRGKSFVLVDDVFTSGETLNSLARALKERGAEKIACITVCIAYTRVAGLGRDM